MKDFVLLASLIVIRSWSHLPSYVSSLEIGSFFGVASYTAVSVCVLYIAKIVRNTAATSKDNQYDGPKVLFFPSRTTHIRFFPKRHSFGYSYLLAGIPIGWQGSVGGMLSVDEGLSGVQNTGKGKTWFSVDAENYLERGLGSLGLKGKLQKYLKDQGLEPNDYPYAYLFTAPKFLGYFNNPVSFWYLYNTNKKLKAMILEVNNTFDERRMYLLTPDDSLQNFIEDASNADDQEEQKENITFSETWAKDFHVSPFSSRKGFYTLNTCDPLAPSMSKCGPLTGTITLKSSKDETKLVARLFSEGPPLDPAAMNLYAKVNFILRWWWVGYLTFPRVAFEAGKLWFKRGLYVWARPEPLQTTVSRNADTTEENLESHFRSYLKFLVESCSKPLRIDYISSGIESVVAQVTFLSSEAQSTSNEAAVPSMTIKVLTPVFYTRFVHYAHDLEALFCESKESNTVAITNPQLLATLVLKKPTNTFEINNWLDAAFFKAIQKLRQRPDKLLPVSYIGKKDIDIQEVKKSSTRSISTQQYTTTADLRSFRPSSMDAFILKNSSETDKKSYRWEVMRLFVADRVASGDVWLLSIEWFILKASVFWILAGFVSRISV